jgi:hypothetical protein
MAQEHEVATELDIVLVEHDGVKLSAIYTCRKGWAWHRS